MLECNFLILAPLNFTRITLFKWVNTLTDTILQFKGVEDEFVSLSHMKSIRYNCNVLKIKICVN